MPKDHKNLLLRPDILEVFGKSHVVALQETWYAKQNLQNLNTLHRDFIGMGAATIDETHGVYHGHYPGGVALFWKKNISANIKRLNFNSDWAVAIEVSQGTSSLVILNVYMPYQCLQNQDQYIDNLWNIYSFIESINTTNFMIIGDWNANLGISGNALFRPIMEEFCNENNLIISTKKLLPQDSHTHISRRTDSTFNSWLDHVVSSKDCHRAIERIDILYDISDDDHIPLTVQIKTDNIPKVSSETNDVLPKVNWCNVKDSDIQKYYKNSGEFLSNIEMPLEALRCNNINCKNKEHLEHLTKFYNNINNSLTKASKHLYNKKSKNYVQRPGWTEYVSELYDYSKTCRQIWLNENLPRQGIIHENYIKARARFKYAVKYIKKNEDKLRKESMAKNLANKDTIEFWKDIAKSNNCKTPLPDQIDEAKGSDNIIKLWKKHFYDIFNCLKSKKEYISPNNLNVPINEITVNPYAVFEAIKELGLNKSCGIDGITAEHLKYASERLPHLLSLAFTGFFIHGFLPESMISVLIVPVIKDKAGAINSKDNYRPIALASIVSKLVEKIMLNRMETHMLIQSNQFGFKKKLGTDQCIFALKELISKYMSKGSCIYTCFLDASKAFDRVNHSKLFKKLADKGVPEYLIRLLIFWYEEQTMCIRWGSKTSEKFNVSNGVRQGSILSPHLFKIYVDDLSVSLNSLKIGCVVTNMIINHLMYADDIVLISPSSAGLSTLIETCQQFGINNDIKFNSTKSAILPFLPEDKKKYRIPSFYLNNEQIPVVSSFKYLGHILTNNGSDDQDIGRQRKKIYAQGNSILRKFYMCSIEVKVMLFKSYCTSLYTAHLWTNYSNKALNDFYIAYHNVMKLFIGLPKREHNRPLCVNHEIPYGPALMRNYVFKFMCRLERSENSILRTINNSDCKYESNIRNKWKELLYILN